MDSCPRLCGRMGLRMQPPHETFVTLFGKAGSNIVESVTILLAFAAVPHESWARPLWPRESRVEHRFVAKSDVC
jgi:hypothetical protein